MKLKSVKQPLRGQREVRFSAGASASPIGATQRLQTSQQSNHVTCRDRQESITFKKGGKASHHGVDSIQFSRSAKNEIELEAKTQ